MRPDPRPALIALFGAGRNGSTMLGRLLDGSGGLWIHPVETAYLTVWDDLARNGAVSAETAQSRRTTPLTALDVPLSTDLLVDAYRHHWREIQETYAPRIVGELGSVHDPVASLESPESYRVAEFLPALLDETRKAWSSTRQVPRLIAFKTIEVSYIDEYMARFPTMRSIHLLRDPVTNYASLARTRAEKRQPFYYGDDQLRMFLDARWLPHAESALRLAESDPDNHLITRYEDILSDPAHEISRICTWLGVDAPSQPDVQTIFGGRTMTSIPSNTSKRGVETPARVTTDLSSRLLYDPAMTARERALIEFATQAPARRLGYEAQTRTWSRGWLWLKWLTPDRSEWQFARLSPAWLATLAHRRAYVTRKIWTSGGRG